MENVERRRLADRMQSQPAKFQETQILPSPCSFSSVLSLPRWQIFSYAFPVSRRDRDSSQR